MREQIHGSKLMNFWHIFVGKSGFTQKYCPKRRTMQAKPMQISIRFFAFPGVKIYSFMRCLRAHMTGSTTRNVPWLDALSEQY
jgi:hypothetical protein